MRLIEIQPHIIETVAAHADRTEDLSLEDQLKHLDKRQRYLLDIIRDARRELWKLQWGHPRVLNAARGAVSSNPSNFYILPADSRTVYAINKNIPDGMKILQSAVDAYLFSKDYEKKLVTCKRQITKVQKEMLEQKVNKEAAISAEKKSKRETYIPPVIYASKDVSINNPFLNYSPSLEHDRKYKYAGPVDQYTFTVKRNADYLAISHILARHGLKFTTVYAGPNMSTKFVDMVVTTSPKNEVVWRREKNVNCLYIYGKFVTVRRLLARDNAFQDNKFPKKKP